MSEEKKVIGVLTSGGDAPGMNAAIRAVVRTGIQRGYKMLGVKHGYQGLIDGEFVELGMRDVSDIIQRGGTMLGTARCAEFRYDEGIEKGKQQCLKQNMVGLVVIGGDGSFRGASDLSRKGIQCIGVPGTIDNDIACSDYTIGYDTAMNTVVEMVDKLRDTTMSHERCAVVEVMGRHAGHIALNCSVACGATGVLIEEKINDPRNNLDAVVDKINAAKANGKRFFVVIVAEGVGNKQFAKPMADLRDPEFAGRNMDTEAIAEYIEKHTGAESRATILGHVQRGGRPTLRDRVVASEMGHHAVELIAEGKSDRVVARKEARIVDYDIQEALKMTKTISSDLYEVMDDTSF
jgi:6-phosphofructokinase 1